MSDNVNIALSDELMSQATGGVSSTKEAVTNYDVIGTIAINLSDGQYQVRLDDGVEFIITTDLDVTEGSKVGLLASSGGWTISKQF